MQHLITPLLAAAASVLTTAPIYADLGDQLAKFLPDDGAANDHFASFVGISGTTAIVAAALDDDNGTDSGSAYLFDTTTGVQIAKLLPDDGAANDQFGFVAVAISGTTAIVGAPGDDDKGSDSGSAYLFDISDPAKPTQLLKLLPDDGEAGHRFGNSVAISGITAIVGASNHDENGSDSGAAYLFDITTGIQIAKLLPDDVTMGDSFGVFVAIDGTTAIAGAYHDDDNGVSSGSAYLFDATTGQQIAKLLPHDGATNDQFGLKVAISGATAIVGSYLDDDNGDDSGSAYLFDATTGRQIAKLLPDDGAASALFGISVAISGDTAVVGAQLGDDNDNGVDSGSAYLFDITTGVQIARLLPDDGAANDQFGNSVAISGMTAIVGAYFDDDYGTNSGSAYLFDAAIVPGKCPWDLDDSGGVGTGDLITLLGAWGSDPGGPPDFDGDGNVGTSDLIELLGNWGPCP